MYRIIFDDGNVRLLVATDFTYSEYEELSARQEKTEFYFIVKE